MVAILAELAAPTSILAAAARPWLTVLQGVWWIQTAYIMCVLLLLLLLLACGWAGWLWAAAPWASLKPVRSGLSN